MSIAELIAVLSPHFVRLHVEYVRSVGRTAHVHARGREPSASCPDCKATSVRVYCRYERRMSDTAVANQQAVLHLRIRRFFCDTGTSDHEGNTGPDTDNVQQGDQRAPDHGTNGEGQEQERFGEAPENGASDGPGGHADANGSVDHQFTGKERSNGPWCGHMARCSGSPEC